MKQRILTDLRASRALRRYLSTETGRGFTSAPDGTEELTYSVYLDHTVLQAMAVKAAGNASGKSRDGALEVVITRRVKIEKA